MRFIVYIIAGLAGGVLGGMGMGGGTVLIPILTIFCGVEQHLAQSANLITFLPMAVFSLQVHASNHLLDTKGIGFIIVPALALSVAGGFLVDRVAGRSLQTGFGVFLCLLSIWQFISAARSLSAQKKQERTAKEN